MRRSGSVPSRWVVGTLLWLGLSSASGAAAQTLEQELETISEDLSALQIERAGARLERLNKSHPKSPRVMFYRGMHKFYLGDYQRAQKLVDEALTKQIDADDRRSWTETRDLITSTLELTRELQRERSRDGRYVVYFMEGPDRVLVPYALGVLEAADRALSAAFGARVPGPIRLEILPSAAALAAVSALTVEQIETTGTIALSKWNRLMITTPRALVRGYPWADTITHEFVHMVLSRITEENAPVWLQEGTAKMLERSWRKRDSEMRLDASAHALLAAARKEDKLLTFDEMHPSIAMLPSQEAAALAFAEVSTFMERYVRVYGRQRLQAALQRVAEGTDARKALAAAASTTFSSLEDAWKAELPTGLEGPTPRHLELRLKSGSGKPDEAQEVEGEARKYLRLGDLLWDRGRTLAAKLEYAKANRAAPDDPIVGSRLARTALAVGDASAAVAAIRPLTLRYPDHAPGHAVLGAAELALGHREQATLALREAIFINPFDPTPHCDLARATDEARERDLEAEACRQLRGQ